MPREKDTYLNREGLEYYHQKVKQEFATKQEVNQGLAQKQDNLTAANAGDGIEITRDQNGKVTISNTNVSAEWGNIQGDITDQTDLINYIDQNGGKIDTIKVNDVAQTVTNKTVNITVPTKTSDLSNDSGFITNSVDNLINYYTKPEVDDLISGAGTNYTAGNGIDITNDVISLKNLILDCGTSTTVV